MSVNWRSDNGEKNGPSWSKVIDEACRQLGYDDPDLLRYRGTDLQILEYFGTKIGNFAPLTNWLVRRLDAPDEAIKRSTIHCALARMMKCSKFYTTNYDDFIERAIRLSGRTVQVVSGERDMGGSGNEVEVVKFHGDFNSPNQMVFSEGHYYQRMRLEDPLDLKLRSDLLGRAAVFIGYSFRDLNIGYLFDFLNAMLKTLPNNPSGRRAYIIVHNPSDFEYTLFRRRNMDVIPTFGDDRTLGIVEAIDDLIS
ncbi:SIR2 family protein [Rhodopseudomonas sp. WA056]|nr:SIR2 family protein [Rhodopseudomonas sp. WA056]